MKSELRARKLPHFECLTGISCLQYTNKTHNLLQICKQVRPKKNTCGSGSRPILFFSADPMPYYVFNAIDRATLFSPGGYRLLIQRAKMASVVTLIIEPNCLNSSIGNTRL